MRYIPLSKTDEKNGIVSALRPASTPPDQKLPTGPKMVFPQGRGVVSMHENGPASADQGRSIASQGRCHMQESSLMSGCGQGHEHRQWLKEALAQVSSASSKQKWKCRTKSIHSHKRLLINAYNGY